MTNHYIIHGNVLALFHIALFKSHNYTATRNDAFHTMWTFSVMQKRVQTSKETVFNKNRVIRTATKRTETRG